jgi:SAM-dependent methyltransferase
MYAYQTRVAMLRSWAAHDANVYKTFTGALSDLGVTLERASVLDIGCGANAPMTLMLHSAGMRVTGIDEYIGYRWGLGLRPQRYWQYLQEAGFGKTLRKIVGEIVYDRHYYAALARAVGFSLTETGLDLRRMSAEHLRFENSNFDIVYSNAAWEHFSDVSQVNREVARVLRTGGIAYIEIHLFPSLSGGHDLPWIVPGKIDLDGIKPWSHLRDHSWTAPVYLNRLREKDYRDSFEATGCFKFVEWKTEFIEGEEFITNELLQELPDYTGEELTKRSVIAILRKTC